MIAHREYNCNLEKQDYFHKHNISAGMLENKRKFSDSFDGSVNNNNGLKKLRFEENEKWKKSQKGKNKSTKKLVKNSKSNIFNIKNRCDCRFCYEDHIIRMRLKNIYPYL